LVAETAADMPSMQGQEAIRNVVVHLKQFQKPKQASSGGK